MNTLLEYLSYVGLFGVIWLWGLIIYAIYFAKKILPQVDKIVDPDLYRYIQSSGMDDLFSKWHRLTFYGHSAASTLANRRLCPNYDFTQLEPALRRKLRVLTFNFWIVCCITFIPAILTNP